MKTLEIDKEEFRRWMKGRATIGFRSRTDFCPISNYLRERVHYYVDTFSTMVRIGGEAFALPSWAVCFIDKVDKDKSTFAVASEAGLKFLEECDELEKMEGHPTDQG